MYTSSLNMEHSGQPLHHVHSPYMIVRTYTCTCMCTRIDIHVWTLTEVVVSAVEWGLLAAYQRDLCRGVV